MSNKPGIGSLLLAGLAAFGLYKYSKMSAEEKTRLKEKGMKLYEENVPESVRGMFGKKADTQPASHNPNSYNQS